MTCPAPKCIVGEWDSSAEDKWTATVRRMASGRKESFFEKVAKRRAAWIDLRQNHHRASLVGLMDAIQRSRSIADLGDNWDGEGSPGYSIETVERAFEFLFANVGTGAPPPQINPGDRGSVDLYWQNGNRYLLVNFPPGLEEPSYYGEDRFGSTTGGVIKSDSMARQVAAWLTEADR